MIKCNLHDSRLHFLIQIAISEAGFKSKIIRVFQQFKGRIQRISIYHTETVNLTQTLSSKLSVSVTKFDCSIKSLMLRKQISIIAVPQMHRKFVSIIAFSNLFCNGSS